MDAERNSPERGLSSPRELAESTDGGFLSSRIFAIVRVVATLAIVGGLIYKLSLEEIVDTIRDADPWLLLAAFALLCVVQALVVLKWLRLLAAREVDAPLLQVIRAYCVGNLLSNVLPTAVGGDVYRIYRIQREASARAADVTMTVLYERATGYVAMTFLGALGAAFYYGNAAIGFLALAAGAAGALFLMWLLPRAPFPALHERHFLRNLISHRRELIAVYQMAVFSLLIQALYISTIAITGRAMGAHISWWFWAFATWVVAVTVLLPITPGGLGVRESSFAGLVHRAGGTGAQGASTGFALAILLIAANTLGLIAVELAERMGFTPDREAPPATADVREPVRVGE